MKKIYLGLTIMLTLLFLFGLTACTEKGERYVTENGITYYSVETAEYGVFSLDGEIKLTFEEK